MTVTCPSTTTQPRTRFGPQCWGPRAGLFSGSDKDGRAIAILSGFIASCRRQEIDPFACLRDVRADFAACPINQIDQFRPALLKTARRIDEA